MNRRGFLGLVAGSALFAFTATTKLAYLSPKLKEFAADITFTTSDLALSLEMFTERILRPQIEAVARRIDLDAYAFI